MIHHFLEGRPISLRLAQYNVNSVDHVSLSSTIDMEFLLAPSISLRLFLGINFYSIQPLVVKDHVGVQSIVRRHSRVFCSSTSPVCS